MKVSKGIESISIAKCDSLDGETKPDENPPTPQKRSMTFMSVSSPRSLNSTFRQK